MLIGCSNIPSKNTFIDSRLSIPHGFVGTMLNSRITIGKNFTIYHNVTIGTINGENPKINIKIGNNVYIGTGSIILGNVIVGDNCRIGAGTIIINKNIPSNCTVVNEFKYKTIEHKNKIYS